ncbi:MAG: hypothetical protein ABI175_05955 [Polyangiales bacterium]
MRFHNQEPVTVVNDRTPLPAPPKTFDEGLVEFYVRQDLIVPARRALTIETPRRAENVNSLGAVPDSSWFENRNLTPEQIRRGTGGGGPDRSEPWRVVGVKVGGAAIGITFEDARKDRYVLKFDERNFPETESSADVIVQRLTWAFGYNVPDNEVVTFKREQLTLDPSAEVKNRQGGKRPMTQADLDQYLGMAESQNGTFRALASRLIGGKIIGGIEPEGVRQGDTNDRVPHELRRDLRGQRVLWAWVNHVDIKSQNSLATLEAGGYVKWYQLDFGESLGVGGRTTSIPRLGYRTAYAVRESALSLVTFGLYLHPWERAHPAPALRGLGDLESEQFDPATWSPNHNWLPTDLADRFDQFWATEILMRLTPAHIQAAVDAGQYTDPRTTAYVVKTLIERQHKIGGWALQRVAPLTGVTARASADGLSVCFDDLWIQHRFGAAADTHYAVASYDYTGAVLAADRVTAAGGANTCVAGVRAGTSHDGYTIIRIRVQRDGRDDPPPLFVHVAAGQGGVRVIGLDRR